jgi:hypothetical protein
MKVLWIIAASLVAFIIPNVVALGIWLMGSNIHPTLRSLTSILGWVVSFGVSTQIFWRIVKNSFPLSSK